jgi:hypothetical protein
MDEVDGRDDKWEMVVVMDHHTVVQTDKCI